MNKSGLELALHFFTCIAQKSRVGGRAVGGVLICVKNCFAKYVKQVCNEFTHGVILVLDKALFSFDKNVLVEPQFVSN